ncbi:GIY-YIG nuclease family protein [Paraburkholderia aromaticivorans]|uniref:GIY-YIG nuclease family protein n=1 Tax=Paraburkholderia aromaticivorans TaxID=2026199 RepID=UPI001455F2D6|nr:GIY-YIG nuclease family protein [Paraburkholderia aromaticivorans]
MSASSAPNAPGVYMIENAANGRVYIGKTKNLGKRFGQHVTQLRKGKHHNTRLQAEWSEFGEPTFTFRVHVLAGESEIDLIEQTLIAENMGDGCFN